MAQPPSGETGDTVYYNHRWKKCSPHVARYYCLPVPKADKYEVTYYTAGHIICYKGTVKAGEKGLYYAIDPETAVKDGYFEYYSPSGHKISEGNFENNSVIGTWKNYFDTTGKLQAVKKFDELSHSGFVTYYHDDGKTVFLEGHLKGVFINDSIRYRRDGEWLYYYQGTGQISAKANYSDGVLFGYTAFYDSATGCKIAEGRFAYGRKAGKWVFYHPPRGMRKAIINYDRGVPSGDFYVFHISSGRLKTSGTFNMGRRTGLWSGLYDSTNLLHWQVEYRNNKGLITYYDSANNSREILEGNLEGNSREGKWSGYYPGNGKLRYIENYKKNILHGKVVNYYENGSIWSELSFFNGQLNGTSTYYYENTKSKWLTIGYTDDGIIDLRAYYPSGKLKREEYKNGVRKCFAENGNEIECEPFRIDASFDGDVMTYIGDNLEYPEEVKLARLEGKVKVGFMVDEWGSIRDPYIIEGFDDRCEAEALRLVSEMPKWLPAKVDGIPIQTHKTLPIVFWLPPDEGATGM